MDPAAAASMFDRAAATYDIAAFPFFGPFGDALVEFAQIQPEERVLDVGCGAGAVLGPVSRLASATGIELSPAMAERARVAAPDAHVVVGDAASLPFDDASFDVVLSSFVVFFLDDPTAALREWRRVIAPGGRLVMSTWNGGDPRWSWEREARMKFVSEIGPDALEEMGQGLALVARFDEEAKVEDELRMAGYAPGAVARHAIEFVYPDEDGWWDWNWSHGSRIFLEALSADAQERFRVAAYEAMQPLRTEAGLPRTYTALFSQATLA